MPNHVTHRCIVTGPDAEIARFRAHAIRPHFDLSAFIEMPEDIKDTVSLSSVDDWVAVLGVPLHGPFSSSVSASAHIAKICSYPWAKEAGIVDRDTLRAHLMSRENWEATKAEAERQISNVAKYGYGNWYGWCIDHWGTKWNAYSYSEVRDEPGLFEFHFDTAWSTPVPVFEAMAEVFPQLRFEIGCYDEGANFAGHGFYNGGEGDEPFKTSDANDDLYEWVYGSAPERDDDAA